MMEDSPPKKKKEKTNSKKEGKKSKSDKSGKDKKKKDPNAPKRNQTAFFIWQQENRPSIKKPGDSRAETATRTGQMWKAISEEDKRVRITRLKLSLNIFYQVFF
jgi:structure-specific recognition protein 1